MQRYGNRTAIADVLLKITVSVSSMCMQYDALQFVKLCNKKRVLVLCSNQAHMHHTYRMLCNPQENLGAGALWAQSLGHFVSTFLMPLCK